MRTCTNGDHLLGEAIPEFVSNIWHRVRDTIVVPRRDGSRCDSLNAPRQTGPDEHGFPGGVECSHSRKNREGTGTRLEHRRLASSGRPRQECGVQCELLTL